VAAKTVLLDWDGTLAGPKDGGARTVERSLVRKRRKMPDPWNAN
jgi:hypothetical protein